ncbi:MAG: hypothetical protein Aurels2KO_20920 [Aureliella sp.]
MGAAGLQDWNYNRTNRSRAAKCFKASYDHDQRKALGRDFELGFKSGFFDLATGRDCRVPPVAPPKYWSASYQTCDSRACVESWFMGYQKGVVAAQGCGLGEFNSVPVSACAPTVNCSGDGACYSGGECSCSGESAAMDGGLSDHVAPVENSDYFSETGQPLPNAGASAVSPVSHNVEGLIGPIDFPVSAPRSFKQ